MKFLRETMKLELLKGSSDMRQVSEEEEKRRTKFSELYVFVIETVSKKGNENIWH